MNMKTTLLTLLLTGLFSTLLPSQYSLLSNDKLMHFGVGYIAGATSTSIASAAGSKNPELWGMFTATLIGVGKEYYDYRSRKGNVEHLDMFMTVLGGVAGSVTVTIPLATKDPSPKLHLGY